MRVHLSVVLCRSGGLRVRGVEQKSERGEVGGSAVGSLGNAGVVQGRVGSLCSDQLEKLQHGSQEVYKKQIGQDVE